MRLIKKYNQFINEGFFKKDEYLRDELVKLSHSDENMIRLSEFVSSLKELSNLRFIDRLEKNGYSKFLINNKSLYKELEKFKAEIKILEETDPKDMYLEDLNELKKKFK